MENYKLLEKCIAILKLVICIFLLTVDHKRKIKKKLLAQHVVEHVWFFYNFWGYPQSYDSIVDFYEYIQVHKKAKQIFVLNIKKFT